MDPFPPNVSGLPTTRENRAAHPVGLLVKHRTAHSAPPVLQSCFGKGGRNSLLTREPVYIEVFLLLHIFLFLGFRERIVGALFQTSFVFIPLLISVPLFLIPG